MKLFFAAPASGLPSLLLAFGSQASFLHFFTKAALAAPARGLPSLLTAWGSQALCANADVAKQTDIRRAIIVRIGDAPWACDGPLFGPPPKTTYRRWPSGIPSPSAFWRSAPTVRFISFEIFTTGV